MIANKEMLKEFTKYKGGHVMVTVNNSQLIKAHVGSMVLTP